MARYQLVAFGVLLCAARLYASSPVEEEEVAIPDYDIVNKLFFGGRHKRQAAGSGSGLMPQTTEGSGMLGGGATTGPPVELIENCSLPNSFSLFSVSVEQDAQLRALCNSICFDQIGLELSVRNMLLGAPTWPQVFQSYFLSADGLRGKDCLLQNNPNRCTLPNSCPGQLNQIRDCQLGCVTHLKDTTLVDSACDRKCSRDCQNDCLDRSDHQFFGFCQSRYLPHPLCNIECSRQNCRSGCGYAQNHLQQQSTYPNIYGPMAPPELTHIIGTRYRVNITAAIPDVPSFLRFGFTTVVLRASSEVKTRYYVLDRSSEINLDDFACQSNITVSFQVATVNFGLSGYSPVTQIDVTNEIVYSREYPDQLNGSQVQVSVQPDDRPGFFLYFTINVSWPLPERHQFAEGYYISLIGTTTCGRREITINGSNATGYLFQVTEAEKLANLRSPPLARCSYTLRVEVLPRNVERGDTAFSTSFSTTFPNPAADAFMVSCSRVQTVSRKYNITLQLNFSGPWFTSQALEAYSCVHVVRVELNHLGNVVPGGNGDFPSGCILSPSTLRTPISQTLRPLDPGHSYSFDLTLRYNLSNVPIPDQPAIAASCVVGDVDVIPLDPVPRENITVISTNLLPVTTNRYQADAKFNFTYTRTNPSLDQEILQFQVWFRQSVASTEENFTETLQVLQSHTHSAKVSQSVFLTGGEIDLYLQIRVRTRDTISDWSSPILIPFFAEATLPDPLTDESFNITEFTYSTSPGIGGSVKVTIRIKVDHEIPINEFSTQLEVWVGPTRLSHNQRDFDSEYVSDFETDSTKSSSVEETIDLPALGVPVYLQIRALNIAGLGGSWSDPEIINVAKIPPPKIHPLSDRQITVIMNEMDGAPIIGFKMTVRWEMPGETPPTGPLGGSNIARRKRDVVRQSTMTVNGLEVAIGLDPIENPYDDATQPDYYVQQVTLAGGRDSSDVNGELSWEDADNTSSNVTMYLQMRSVAGGAKGEWSDAIAIPVDLTAADATTTDDQDFAVRTEEGGSNVGLIVGVSFLGIVIIVILAVIVGIIIYFCYAQYKLKDSLKGGDDKAMKLWMDEEDTPYIAPGLVKGKELMVDEWEIPTADVIVEDHLGEGAFGLVFKGTIRGPLRNPKLSSKLKHTIGLAVAVKLLKDTATRKERSDFLTEIDMMKKISEGYCSHIVNMVGCVTLQEPLCLITEFVPHGDLLDYLRNQRKKKATRQREEKYLRLQLEQQRKAYEDMKRQMEMLKGQQSESRETAGSSGYADFPGTDSPRDHDAPTILQPPEEKQEVAVVVENGGSSAGKEILGVTNVLFESAGNGDIPSAAAELDKEGGASNGDIPAPPTAAKELVAPAPYLETSTEYSHLDPVQPEAEPQPAEEEPEDVYADLGDIDGNDLTQFAYQIATGMEYLSSINIVHRDLACRNILVGDGKNLKITDFGLSREVEDVYVKTTKGRLPLKWMALESIEAREFTTLSDVWSYGVTLWEIGTMGGFPYPTIQNQDLLMMLKQGYRLEKPENCAPEVYNIMLECWQEHPIDRPTFSELRKKFSDLLMASTTDSYMMLEVDENKTYYTMAEKEEKEFKTSQTSLCSTDSDSSIKKPKKKVIEKPKWAQDANAYVDTPSTFKEGHTHVVDEHYRHNTVGASDLEEVRRAVLSKDGDGTTIEGISNGEVEVMEQKDGSHAASLRTNSVPVPTASQMNHLDVDDTVGIPLSFVTVEKPANQNSAGHKPLKQIKSNPYVDDPRTRQPLEDPGSNQFPQAKIAPLTAELNARMGRQGEEEDEERVTAM